MLNDQMRELSVSAGRPSPQTASPAGMTAEGPIR